MTALSTAAALLLYDLARDEHRDLVNGVTSYGTESANDEALETLSEAMAALREIVEATR
jgi:hypothetical protein